MTAPPSDLMAGLQFTEADLRANQNGALSQEQSARLSRDLRRILLVSLALFFTFVLVSTVLIYLGQTSQSRIALVAGFALVLMNGLSLGLLGREYMRLSSDLRLGAVDALVGKVERILKRGRRGDRYFLRIEDEEINVSRDLADCFRHGAPYRIHRTRRAKILLSAKPLDEPGLAARQANESQRQTRNR